MALNLPEARTQLENASRYAKKLISLIDAHENGNIIFDIPIPQAEKDEIKSRALLTRTDFQAAAMAAIQNLTP